MCGRLGGEPLTSSADPTATCLQAGQLARPHEIKFDHVVAAGPPGPDRGADDVAPGVAGVGPDRRLPCHADGPGGVIGSAARVAPARPGGGDHGRGQRRGECRELGVAALDVGVAVGHARLGVARTSRMGSSTSRLCHLLAPVSSPAKTRPASGASSPAVDRVELVLLDRGPDHGFTRGGDRALPHIDPVMPKRPKSREPPLLFLK